MAMIKCPECGHQISDKAPVCPNCGVEIAGKIMKCPQCGEIYFKEQEMCPNCHHLTRLSGTVGNAGASASGQTADPSSSTVPPRRPASPVAPAPVQQKRPTPPTPPKSGDDKPQQKKSHTPLVVGLILRSSSVESAFISTTTPRHLRKRRHTSLP